MKKKATKEVATPEQEEETQIKELKVKKVYTLRFYMMILSGGATVLGAAFFVIYFITTNMALGAIGAIVFGVGILTFRYYWKKEGSISIEHIGGVKGEKDINVNSLTIYQDKVVFEDVYNPEGFPMLCLNDNRKYFVNIQDEKTKRLGPFVLPDQQYYDPIVFAQRVLGLPAHKKIFERKPKLIQKLKTALLVLAIGIVWLLILTTTGG